MSPSNRRQFQMGSLALAGLGLLSGCNLVTPTVGVPARMVEPLTGSTMAALVCFCAACSPCHADVIGYWALAGREVARGDQVPTQFSGAFREAVRHRVRSGRTA
jgi:hypothetical protein